MSQQRLELILRFQKINPDLGRGFWGGGPMGPDMMYRGKTGPCGRHHRGPENCIHGASGRGCGKGPGPQMMRSPCGWGMDPRMMKPVGDRIWGHGNCPYDAPADGYGMGPRYGKGLGMKSSGGPDSENIRQPDKGPDPQPE